MLFGMGAITLTMNNLSIEAAETVEVRFAEGGYKVTEAKIVTQKHCLKDVDHLCQRSHFYPVTMFVKDI